MHYVKLNPKNGKYLKYSELWARQPTNPPLGSQYYDSDGMCYIDNSTEGKIAMVRSDGKFYFHLRCIGGNPRSTNGWPYFIDKAGNLVVFDFQKMNVELNPYLPFEEDKTYLMDIEGFKVEFDSVLPPAMMIREGTIVSIRETK